MKAWEEVAMSIIQSLSEHEISPELAEDWLRMILNYAESLEKDTPWSTTGNIGRNLDFDYLQRNDDDRLHDQRS